MRERTPSSTALAGAAVRALEVLLPLPERWCEDRLAASFLQPWHRALLWACARNRTLRDAVERMLDARHPGAPLDFIVRTRWIDERVVRWLQREGAERLLIIGAGYDTRALRLSMSAHVECIEVDHPATQQRKRRLASRAAAARASAVTWIAQDLASGCPSFGAPKRTFTIIEGLTSYLAADAVEEILSRVTACSAAGSELVFTYIERNWLDAAHAGADVIGGALARELVRRGEPFRTGFAPAAASSLLECFGLTTLEDVDEGALSEEFSRATGRSLHAISGFRLVLARIAPLAPTPATER